MRYSYFPFNFFTELYGTSPLPKQNRDVPHRYENRYSLGDRFTIIASSISCSGDRFPLSTNN
ncbi:MAG: hypothetical protein AAGF83_10040 [Cyanobacteria bacterium P01_G01_bin.67]